MSRNLCPITHGDPTCDRTSGRSPMSMDVDQNLQKDTLDRRQLLSAGMISGVGLLLADVELKGLEFIVRHVDYLYLCTNSIIFIYKKSRSLRSQDSAPGKKILTCFGALPARTHSSGGGQSTAVRPEFCPVCVHSPTTEVCMKQVFPNQRHRGALLSLNFPPSWWIGWLHYIPIYLDCQ